MNSQKMDIKDLYITTFNKFETELNGDAAHPLHQVRKNAISRVAELGFSQPTKRRVEVYQSFAYFKANISVPG